jgi:stage II sporulation protein D
MGLGGGEDAPPPVEETPAAQPDRQAITTVPEGPLIRVGLERTATWVAMGSSGHFTVDVYADSVRHVPTQQGKEWRFRAGGRGIEGRGPSSDFEVAEGTVRVRPTGGKPLVVDGTAYRGEVELFLAAPGTLSIVNVVGLESYLRGVVPKEIGPRPIGEIEAVKAQAIAARTYAVASDGGRSGGDFDLFSTVRDQVYGGVDVETDVCDRAIAETAGLVARRDGEPINAYFYANCGGRTEAREEVWELEELPYLVSVWDTPGGSSRREEAYCRGGANFDWSAEWTGVQIEMLVQDYLPRYASTPVRESIGAVHDVKVTERTPSGRVRWLEIRTDAGTYRVFGDRSRWVLQRPKGGGILWSARFELGVEKSGGRVSRIRATGKGYGHGVGMCQHGAMEMARRGHSHGEILRHYYAGIEIAPEYVPEAR